MHRVLSTYTSLLLQDNVEVPYGEMLGTFSLAIGAAVRRASQNLSSSPSVPSQRKAHDIQEPKNPCAI
jgi:hypothetical protein